MSQIQIQQERLTKMSDILKSDFAKQFIKIQNKLSEPGTNKRCALGLVMSYFGWNGNDKRGISINTDDVDSCYKMVIMNNATDLSFYEIGEKLENTRS